ncbi:flagellar hook-length control protein FliK [Cellvibrio sp. OA-2007]|uniref:flagellar hook-length control protein FliK n=1 Tax=Cellvibrio sp. OA-2007 TaxID=529823 RepID=UPI000786455E|nr:flagellar hook-length control protein FliK [Cellvibrio sp. OA-2007]
MNNSNFLNSLLGLTSANPAATKSMAAKARVESTEKFHQALEQVRPEIAARKPVVRKENPPAEPLNATRAAAKVPARQDSQRELARSDTSSKTDKNDQQTTAVADHSVQEKNEYVAQEKDVSEEQSAAPHDQLGTRNAAQEKKSDLSEVAQADIALDDPALAVATDSGELDNAVDSSAHLLGQVSLQPLATQGSANEDEIDVSVSSEDMIVIDPSLVAMNTPLRPIEIEGDAAADGEQAVLVGLQLVSKTQLVAGAATAGVDAQSAPAGIATGATQGGANAEIDLAPNTDADVLLDTETGDNPDFALLNSKAALNKLAETTMAAANLDKTSSAVDVKPAIISAAVEAMTRLTDAQSPAARAFVVQTGVPVTVGSPQWSQAVGDKVLWLAAQNVSAAEIRLDPPELGPMQVKVSVNQDQASVTFSSPHPAVREALDQQLNRLREMFSEQGLNLVNVDVSDKSFTKREQEESAGHQSNGGDDDEELSQVAVSQTISMRLVDHYA